MPKSSSSSSFRVGPFSEEWQAAKRAQEVANERNEEIDTYRETQWQDGKGWVASGTWQAVSQRYLWDLPQAQREGIKRVRRFVPGGSVKGAGLRTFLQDVLDSSLSRSALSPAVLSTFTQALDQAEYLAPAEKTLLRKLLRRFSAGGTSQHGGDLGAELEHVLYGIVTASNVHQADNAADVGLHQLPKSDEPLLRQIISRLWTSAPAVRKARETHMAGPYKPQDGGLVAELAQTHAISRQKPIYAYQVHPEGQWYIKDSTPLPKGAYNSEIYHPSGRVETTSLRKVGKELISLYYQNDTFARPEAIEPQIEAMLQGASSRLPAAGLRVLRHLGQRVLEGRQLEKDRGGTVYLYLPASHQRKEEQVESVLIAARKLLDAKSLPAAQQVLRYPGDVPLNRANLTLLEELRDAMWT